MWLNSTSKLRLKYLNNLRSFVDKWEFAGPPYYAPQVRSSLQRQLFFTICRRQILHHAQRAFFTTAKVVPPPKYRERSEPNC